MNDLNNDEELLKISTMNITNDKKSSKRKDYLGE